MRKRTIHKAAAALTALALCAGVLTGCGGAASSTTASSTAGSAASSEVSGEEADELAAKNVADLIDAIYVQERTDDTDAQCEAAKAAWDALTDAQKELVEGEEADPDYFGRDTGDASKTATICTPACLNSRVAARLINGHISTKTAKWGQKAPQKCQSGGKKCPRNLDTTKSGLK